MTATKDNEKQLLIKQAKSILGYYDYWAGYPDIAKTLRKYGPYKLKQGKLVTGLSLQVNNLKTAIKDANLIKDMQLTLRYKKHDYSLPKLCKKILNVLNLALKGVMIAQRKDEGNDDLRSKTGQAKFSLNGSEHDDNINAWAEPVIENRRKKPEYQRARKYMQNAQQNWLSVNSEDDDSRLIYFVSDTTIHNVSSNNIYNLLTKDFPW